MGEWRNVNLAFEEIGKELDWVLKLHADNPLKPHWLGVMLQNIESCSNIVATVSCSWDVRTGGTIKPGEDKPKKEPVLIEGTAQSVRDTLMLGCWWHNHGSGIRMKAFWDIGPFDSNLKQKGDWQWLLRCLDKGWVVQYVPRTLFYYDIGGESTLSSINFQRDLDIGESLRIFQEFLQSVSWTDIFFYFTCDTWFSYSAACRVQSFC